jgi:outer membrane receptor protein involved in Fe transport|nr:TonB-dependent receptor [Kofleriaceae bacterium]
MSRLRAALFGAVLVIPAIPSLAHASPDATISGVVEDALLHPMTNATVILHDTSGATVAKLQTGADGKFAFPNIAFGDYSVEASSPGLVGDHQHIQLTAAGIAPIELVLTSNDEVIQIHEDWAVPAPPTASGSVSTVTRQALQERPGGEDRPVTDVVASQPGVVADALGNIYVRGNHANVQYQVDGIPVPDSVGSLFAASIPVRLVQQLDVLTGGMPAEFGDRLGAVVNLQTRQAGEHPDGSAQVRYGSFQTTEPAAAYATKLGDTTGMFVGGSYLYSQRALDPPSIDPILHDTGTSGRVFGRADWNPCTCNHFELFVTYAHNRFEVPIDPSVAPLAPGQTSRPPDQFGNDSPPFIPHDTNSTETEDELFAAVSFTHKFDDGKDGQLQIAPIYKLSRGVLFGDPEHALGALADPGSTASNVTRDAQHAGGVAAYSLQRGGHAMKFGVQTDSLFGRTEFASFVRDDGNGGGIDPTMTGRGTDITNAITSGAYGQDRWTTGKLAVDFGLRVDEIHVSPNDQASHDDVGVSPRLGASLGLGSDVVVHAYTGVLWQPPAPLDAGDAARALGVVPAGTPVPYDLEPETDLYAELGVSARLVSQLRGTLNTYGRYAYDQLDDTAIGSTSLLSNYNFDRGRATGVEAALDMRIGPWLTAFANGSLSLAEGEGIASAKYLFTAAELADTSWQTLDHAQTWTANAGATVRDKRFTASAVMAYGSGLRTGADNNDHVPGHLTVDTTMAYTFTPHAYPIRVAADVVNLFDDHYAYRIANGFVGSSFGAPRSVYLSISIPLAAEPHHDGE